MRKTASTGYQTVLLIHYRLGVAPLTVTVTTRIITCLLGDPYKPSFPTVAGRGPYPNYRFMKCPKPTTSDNQQTAGCHDDFQVGFISFSAANVLFFPHFFSAPGHVFIAMDSKKGNECWAN